MTVILGWLWIAMNPVWAVTDADVIGEPTCQSGACHTVELPGGAIGHPPYMENNCTACHEPHRSLTDAPLKPDLSGICLECHDEVETGAGTAVVHPAEGGECISCHNPHQSRVRNLVRSESVLAQCSECHAPMLEESRAMPHRHEHFDPRRACGDCHRMHRAGEDGKYLRDDVTESCLGCHDLPIRTRDRTLENIAAELRTQPYHHAALDEAGCEACHTPHGSKQASLMREGYPAGSYAQYENEGYDLCWKCHDSGLVEAAQTVTATGFRDGERNLHRVHVLAQKRGRSCHLCHQAHAADQPHLLRKEIPFNQWSGPMEWEAVEDGGRCATPCHREAEYRRDTFVSSEGE